MPRLTRFSSVVFASSTAEGRRIAEYSRSSVRVVSVGLGLSRELTEGQMLAAVPGLQTNRFLLTVGRLNPRKNLERTIRAAVISGVVTPDYPLVIAGAGDIAAFSKDPEIRDLISSGRLLIMGHVSDDQLRWLYVNTSLFLYLSLGEGFGMPPVEARAFGARVLVSDLPVMRENLREEASYVCATNVEAISVAIVRCLLEERAHQTSVFALHDWSKSVNLMRSTLSDLIGRS